MHLFLTVLYWQKLQPWLIEWLGQTQFILIDVPKFLSERFNQSWLVFIFFPQLTSGSFRLVINISMFLFPSLGSIWYRFTNQFRMTTATIKCFISTTSSRIAAKINASLYTLDKNTRLKLAFVRNYILLKAVSLTTWISSSLNPKHPRQF